MKLTRSKEWWLERARLEGDAAIGVGGRSIMTPAQQERALMILHRMSCERERYWFAWRRWWIADEPLRNDAGNLLREIGFEAMTPDGFMRTEGLPK